MRVGAEAAIRMGRHYRLGPAAITRGPDALLESKPRMSPSALRRQIGQLLIAGFDGQQVPVELRSLAREFGLGGVILFARNIGEPEQVAELCFDAARLVPQLPLWVSVDQEGGRVARLKAPFTEWPAMATLGRSGDVRLAERFARALAVGAEGRRHHARLRACARHSYQSEEPGDRRSRAVGEGRRKSRGSAPRSSMALQGEGVAACGKHFPGHGDTQTDSHLELPLVEHPLERLRSVEFVPFRAAIAAGVATIMTAHVFMPALDEKRPATLSRRIVFDLLRDELEVRGRDPERRSRDEGDRQHLRGAGGGRPRGRRGVRRDPDLQRRSRHAVGGARSADLRRRKRRAAVRLASTTR